MSQHRPYLVLNSLGLIAIAAIAGHLAQAGPLDPPLGPVAPSYKTLTEVEPRIAIGATNTPGDADSMFKITQPGSYYLTGNITGIAGKHGIEITASGVALDLNGFDLVGGGGTGNFDGVSVTVNGLTDIAVCNGSVRNWPREGVDLGAFAVRGCRVDGIRASGNAGNGISVGTVCAVANCSMSLNAFSGIFCGNGTTLSNCMVFQNTFGGITAFDACILSNCSVFQNAGAGITVGNACTLNNCAVHQNADNGITTGNGATVSYCSATSNGGGIFTGLGATVAKCSAYQNASMGFSISSGSTVADCTARNNTLDGIVCTAACLIRGNTCFSNGNGDDGAGIRVTGNDNRIEANNCASADRGIDVDGGGNIIVGNTCSGNSTNWAIAANNYYGPIIDRTSVLTAAVNGSAAGGTLATSDPHANFSY